MLYGRRVIESHHWLYRNGALPQLQVVDKKFQWKYTIFLLAAVVGSALIFLLPAAYFLNQNYQIFTTLAYRTEPLLVEHLERETLWLSIFLGIGIVSLGTLCLSIGLKLTESLVGPLVSIERHMKKVTYGDWTKEDFRIRSTDDYRSLANTYGYMYKSLRAQALQDLKWLDKIAIDPQNREAVAAWEALVKTKHAQLGIMKNVSAPIEQIPIGIVALSAEAQLKRHAS
jgi:hypothetical protein